jgi:hypothetical protein
MQNGIAHLFVQRTRESSKWMTGEQRYKTDESLSNGWISDHLCLMANPFTAELGRQVGADIFAAGALSTDWFLSELKKESATAIPQEVTTRSTVEPVFFAVSHLTGVIYKKYTKPDEGDFLRQVNDAALGLLCEFCFESELKGSDFEGHKSKMGKYYYYWLGVRHEYYSEHRRKLRVRLASLISSRQVTDGVLLRAIFEGILEDEQFRVSDKLLRDFAARVVEDSYEIPTRHLKEW